MHKLIPLSLVLASAAFGAQTKNCAPQGPAKCYSESCECVYCLGRPSPLQGNTPVNPKTCNGDLGLEIDAFYWNAHLDGMEYAIDSQVRNPGNDTDTSGTQILNQLVNAKYLTPDFDWNWGFKAGLFYNSPCDGWDFGVLWTWYKGSASSHDEAERDDNHSLLPLWSSFAPYVGGVLFATDIETCYNLKLNLIDLELGRQYWTSRYLSIRPFVGIRIAYIDQDFDIEQKGGSWTESGQSPLQNSLNNSVGLDNDFKGAGLRSGLDSSWNFGCGWALYGNVAASLVYGKFSVEHDEWNREAGVQTGTANYAKTKILETHESFRVSRAMLDLALGIQYSTQFCDCDYALAVRLSWEQHLFFHQNQMWRVVRINDDASTDSFPNQTGENVYHQRRGNLDTQGFTLTVKFEF